MSIGSGRCGAAARGALEEAELEEVRFVDVFDRFSFFLRGRRERAEADRSAVEFFDNREEQMTVDGIEAEWVDREHGERGFG